MENKIRFITIGVDDVARTVAFCQMGLGLELASNTDSTFQNGLMAFIELGASVKLAIWRRSALELEAHERATMEAVTIPIRRDTREAVVAFLLRAENAGAEVVQPISARPPWVYCGRFRDPDGYIWEVVCDASFAPH